MFSSAHTDDKCQATTVPRARLERLPTEDFLLNEMGKDPFRDRSLSSTNRTDTSGAEWIHKVVLAVLTAVSLGLVCMNYMTACDGTLAANSSDLGSELGVKAASMLQLGLQRAAMCNECHGAGCSYCQNGIDPKHAVCDKAAPGANPFNSITKCATCSGAGSMDKGMVTESECAKCIGTGVELPIFCKNQACEKVNNHADWLCYGKKADKVPNGKKGYYNFCSDACEAMAHKKNTARQDKLVDEGLTRSEWEIQIPDTDSIGIDEYRITKREFRAIELVSEHIRKGDLEFQFGKDVKLATEPHEVTIKFENCYSGTYCNAKYGGATCPIMRKGYRVSEKVDFFSESSWTWVRSTEIKDVNNGTGEVQLACNPGEWLSLADATRLVRRVRRDVSPALRPPAPETQKTSMATPAQLQQRFGQWCGTFRDSLITYLQQRRQQRRWSYPGMI